MTALTKPWFKKEEVDTQYFQKHGDDLTAYSLVMVDKTGERTIFSYKGEGQHFDVSKVPFDQMQAKWLFLDSLGGHYELLEKAVDWAVFNGVKIATNPGSKELNHGLEKLKPILKKCSVVIMNDEEARKVVAMEHKSEEEVFKIMSGVVGDIFVMTKGPSGVIASDKNKTYTAGIPDSPVIERTGAGDAFSSGFVSEYMRSNDIEKAIQFGTANASSVVTEYGGKAGILKQGDFGPWPLVKVNAK